MADDMCSAPEGAVVRWDGERFVLATVHVYTQRAFRRGFIVGCVLGVIAGMFVSVFFIALGAGLLF